MAVACNVLCWEPRHGSRGSQSLLEWFRVECEQGIRTGLDVLNPLARWSTSWRLLVEAVCWVGARATSGPIGRVGHAAERARRGERCTTRFLAGLGGAGDGLEIWGRCSQRRARRGRTQSRSQDDGAGSNLHPAAQATRTPSRSHTTLPTLRSPARANPVAAASGGRRGCYLSAKISHGPAASSCPQGASYQGGPSIISALLLFPS
ncbi:hypothetical protein BOTBODRAFT_339818 [Botryobasidium botryosum FD-172 SS1]|uniref:Uncharacterized protein n=1 Tax=Botryobasidium botryosum (strain FD-172 SS1) TaxID=930990 RepID=A0A067MT47_BOTB1|nr:hypothetical protein BOTBODRAFT_339818 [Botryobasidium botryosum FD-172 SS1]